MSAAAWLQLAVFCAAIAVFVRPLGRLMFRLFEEGRSPLSPVLAPVERALYRLSGVKPDEEQNFKGYAASLLAFSLVGVLVLYLLQRLQQVLPLNPRGFPAVSPDLSINTAVSFVTNTNWQSYGGETTLGHLVQMVGLTWQNFVSAAAGLGVALALARGLTRSTGTLGNFWVDVIRGTLHVLLPISIVAALFFVSQGVPQTLEGAVKITTLAGNEQTIAVGPTASQLAIKMLGTNGGGFFNANSAHPFENPGPLSNFVQMWLIFLIPAALTYTYGLMAKDTRQGWAIFGAMAALFLAGVVALSLAESAPHPATTGLSIAEAGHLEGKETRFGIGASALFATTTTAASCGAVNAMHDSFSALGGLVPLFNIQLGEVVFGGVGAGLYGMLIYVVLTVFIAGLMVGRTPEYLGKKIEAREVKLAVLYVVIAPLSILAFSAWALSSPLGTAGLQDAGPHGLSEVLYAFSSGTGNNGSAFAGLTANSPFYNVTLAIAMFAGRFLMILPALALAGAMAQKRVAPPGPGTFPTGSVLFAALLVAVVLIVGGLTFFPALSLGPILEHFAAGAGRVF